MQTIVEYLREQIITDLYKKQFGTIFTMWLPTIQQLIPNKTEMQILNLGDHLSDIFQSTSVPGRAQATVSIGGDAWEALICWYLNLCLIGRRTVVIQHKKKYIPAPVSDAITVTYNNVKSNTESDLIAITFPKDKTYDIDKFQIKVNDINGNQVDVGKIYKTGRSVYHLKETIDALAHRDFNKLEIHIIQSKTNWNDNAQIPMLWDAVYAAKSFTNGVTVGSNGYSLSNVKRFTYSFVTVPTNTRTRFSLSAAPVVRVRSLSGGNYWGKPTKQGVANSLKEMLDRNLKNGSSDSILDTIKESVPDLQTTYSYFGI